MEATLSEISAMIQQLTDQMLLQHGMIETISDHAQDSVTNIKQVRRAAPATSQRHALICVPAGERATGAGGREQLQV